VLRPIKDFASSFVDDMAVHSSDFQLHLSDLDNYFETEKVSLRFTRSTLLWSDSWFRFETS